MSEMGVLCPSALSFFRILVPSRHGMRYILASGSSLRETVACSQPPSRSTHRQSRGRGDCFVCLTAPLPHLQGPVTLGVPFLLFKLFPHPSPPASFPDLSVLAQLHALPRSVHPVSMPAWTTALSWCLLGTFCVQSFAGRSIGVLSGRSGT